MGKHRQPSYSQKKTQPGYIRIISGLWRGRKLPIHNAEGLRPTTDRVKETLFNWLAPHLPDARCLDLFSGSGSLGFEAASRQASQVTMVELNSSTYRQLQHNKQLLSATHIDIIKSDAITYLSQIQPKIPYDIIFIDPPFHQNLLKDVFKQLESEQWIAEDAFIYVESEKEWLPDAIPHDWQLHREKNAGQVCYRLFQRKR
jgi:16S rRNA (guanine966-N2)-methyltransferase